MIVEPFLPRHMVELELQPAQLGFRDDLLAADWDSFAACGEAWSGFMNGRLVGCAGIMDLGFGRGEAWAVLGADLGAAMVPITRAVRRALTSGRWRYVQAHTAANFVEAGRWATMLGFASRGVLPGYCANGADAVIWTRTI